MANIRDYLHFRGDLSLLQDPFNEVDGLILSEISYIDYSGIVKEEPDRRVGFEEATEAFFDGKDQKDLSLGAILPDEILDLCKDAATAPRFSGASLTAYRNVKKEGAQDSEKMQWAVLTFLLPDDSLFIAFSGTDDSLVSWKEDLDMAVEDVLPSQKLAVAYINELASAYPGKLLRIGGHSKGGNIAVYSAANCAPSVQDRILTVYDNDGPGFSAEFLASPGYKRIKEKVVRILPSGSVVGLFFENDRKPIVVNSNAKGVFQHDGLSWQIYRNGFEKAPGIRQDALLFQNVLKKWLSLMEKDEKSRFVEIIYRFFSGTQKRTLTELSDDKLGLLSSYKSLSPEERALVRRSFGKLWSSGKKVYATELPKVLREGKQNVRKSKPVKERKKDFLLSVDGTKLYTKKSVQSKK